ncbi:MAG: hypothetical protein J6C30_04410 [Lentisphaeria bacterium]|nr:hypothetical protein [Lentisphaeria bacterium]
MLKHISRNILASVVLLCCATSCCVADWYHDLVYGNAPLPTDPIAPAPGGDSMAVPVYTPDEIVTLASSDLIFFFTANGIRRPGVVCDFTLPDGELLRIGTRISGDLAKNKVISPVPEKVEYLLQFSRVGKDVIRIDLQKVNGKKILFTGQYKVKGIK